MYFILVSAGIQNEFLADIDNCFFFPLLTSEVLSLRNAVLFISIPRQFLALKKMITLGIAIC